MDRAIDKKLLADLAEQLSTPAGTVETLSLCSHDSDRFAGFIEMLPINSPAECGKLLYALLKELSVLKIKPSQKLTLLNLARPTTQQCATRLSRTGLSKETSNAVSLCQALLKHLAAGYRSLVKELALSKQSSVPIPQLAQAIFHSLQLQGLIYLKCLQFYLGTPRSYWADLHLQYRIATLCKITDNPNPGREKGSEPSMTIHDQYLRTLLLACSNPNHLSSNDLASTYEALAEWAPMTDLVSITSPGLFAVDSDSDLPPFYASNLTGSKHTHLKIHTSKLVDNLQHKLDNFPDASVIDKVSPRLIRTLLDNWRTEYKRLEERLPEQSEVRLIYGLSHIHETLTGKSDFDDYLDSLSAIAKRKKSAKPDTIEFSRSELFKNDVWRSAIDTEASGSFPIRQETLEVSESPLPSKQAPTQPASLHALVHNRSANGMCVELDPGKSPKLAPGEIVAVKESNTNQWTPGIVRWKRTTPTLTIMLGIELLEGDVQARAARVMRSGKAPGPYLPALMLTAESGPAHLVTPSMPFKHGDQVHLLGGESAMMARLSTPLDTTGFIGRFALHVPSEKQDV